MNSGLGFIYSSGTVGACFEANIAGVPALAFSQAFDSATMSRYVADYSLSPDLVTRLTAQTSGLLDRCLACFLREEEYFRNPITWSINFPFVARDDARLRVCPAGKTFYGSCFKLNGFAYEHRLSDVDRDPDPDCDAGAILSGDVSITPLDIRVLGQHTQEEIERHGRFFAEKGNGF
jgi:5'/3'-nucleotidase SurE